MSSSSEHTNLTTEEKKQRVQELKQELHSTQAEMVSLYDQLQQVSATFQADTQQLMTQLALLHSKQQIQSSPPAEQSEQP